MKRILTFSALLLALAACGREIPRDTERFASAPARQCVSQGQTYEIGESWQCDCNSCYCDEYRGEAAIVSTLMGCN